MSKVLSYCVDLLVNIHDVKAPDAPDHPFTVHCLNLESKSKRSRLAFPAIYLVLGLVLGAVLINADPSSSDRWNKVFGAVVGVFSALLAFWKPSVELEQSDCVELLGGKKLTAADIASINKLLSLPTKSFENVVKLVSAMCSFLAIYLLTGK